ncbi:MAG: hypothetical protein LBU43_01295 [Candidatus Accumulibacter sp.]|nr:hypothetical protein [Accumulibacter sp.]
MTITAIELLIRLRGHFAAGLPHEAPEVHAEIKKVLDFLPPLETTPEPDIPASVGEPKLLPAIRIFLNEHPEVLGGGWKALAESIPWRYSYAPRDDDPGLDTRMGWYEFIGPAAPMRSDRVGFGLMYLGPDTHYRPHAHPAAELYGAVSGLLPWKSGEHSGVMAPGEFLYNPPRVVHSMRSGDEPVLLVYSWTGDIVSGGYYLDVAG